MKFSDDEKILLRESCKDEESYQVVLSLFDKKLADQQNETDLSRFQDLIEQSTDTFIVHDDSANFINANPAATELLGYTYDELLALNWHDVIAYQLPEEHAKLREEWTTLNYMRGDLHIRCKDKSERLVQYVTLQNIISGYHVTIMKNLASEAELQDQFLKTVESLLKFQELAHLGSWEIDLTRSTVTWSDETYRICGLDKDTTDLSIELVWSVFHPNDLPFVQAAIQESELQDEPFRFEAQIVRPNGDIRWVLAQGAFQIDKNANIRVLSGTFLDITQRKQVEIELQANRELYRSLVNTLPLNVFRIDVEGRITFANKSMLNSMNATEDEVIGHTAYDFYPEADVQKYRRDNTYVIETGETLHVIEDNVSPVTQERHTVETFKIPIYDLNNNIIGIQGVYWDITERKQAEDALRESEIRANAILQAMPDMLFHIHRDGTYLNYFGDGTNTILSSVDEVIDSNLSDYFTPELTQLIKRKIELTLATEEVVTFEYQLNNQTDDLDYEARMVKVNDDEVFAIIRDITQRNLAIQREVDIKLERARSEVLSQFIQSASHEFRTPLAIIGTSLYLIETSTDSERIQQKIKQIENQVDRLARLVDMQLRIVRLNALNHLSLRAINITNLIETIQLSLVSQYGDKPTLVTEIPPNLPSLLGHEEYLSVAITQILDNAFRYTAEDGHIVLSAAVSNKAIVLTIEDTGLGIHESVMPYVFEMFWRGDESHHIPGFGLGLTMAKKIIDLHSGEIMLQSEFGQGTQVTITLPTIL